MNERAFCILKKANKSVILHCIRLNKYLWTDELHSRSGYMYICIYVHPPCICIFRAFIVVAKMRHDGSLIMCTKLWDWDSFKYWSNPVGRVHPGESSSREVADCARGKSFCFHQQQQPQPTNVPPVLMCGTYVYGPCHTNILGTNQHLF